MPSENITIRSGINPSKFMGSSYAAGSSLEKRVGNNEKRVSTNERKITLLKNIINYKDSLLPIPKPEDKTDNTNLNIADRLDNIGEALGVIGGLFKIQLSSLQDKAEEDRQDVQNEKRRERESELEAKKATKSKPDSKSKLKMPKLGFFDTLKKFFLNVAFGAATLKLVEWFKDEGNREKILSFTNWIKDNAKSIFITLAAIVALDIASKFIGILATLKIIGGILLSPKFLALLSIIGGAVALDDFRNKEFRLNEKVLNQKVKKEEKKLGRDLTEKEIDDISLSKGVDQGLGADRNLTAGTSIASTPGSGMGYSAELGMGYAIGEWLKRLFKGKKKEFSKGGRPLVGEVATVGEQGRELFIADTPGTIVSNNKTENVFNGGALLVAKSNVINKASSISQRVTKKRTPNLIDLRGKSGGSSSNPTFTTGDQLSSVPSEDSSNIDLVSGSLVYGLVG